MHPLLRARGLLVALSTALLFGGCYASHRLEDEGGDGAASDGGMHGGDAGPGSRDAGPDACIADDCEVAAQLDGLRWALPCTGPTERDDVCQTLPGLDQTTRLEGAPGTRYDVTVRFRGVVETKAYPGGIGDGLVSFGGRPSDTAWNLYELRIGSPARRIFLNAGPDRAYACVPLDATLTIPIDVGSTVRLLARAYDDRQIPNRDASGRPIVVSGVPPAPAPFDGQFIQMDVLEVRAR